MSNYLKRAVQRLLIQKRHRSYEERIARQAVPYGVWLESLLEGERAETTGKRRRPPGERTCL